MVWEIMPIIFILIFHIDTPFFSGKLFLDSLFTVKICQVKNLWKY